MATWKARQLAIQVLKCVLKLLAPARNINPLISLFAFYEINIYVRTYFCLNIFSIFLIQNDPTPQQTRLTESSGRWGLWTCVPAVQWACSPLAAAPELHWRRQTHRRGCPSTCCCSSCCRIKKKPPQKTKKKVTINRLGCFSYFKFNCSNQSCHFNKLILTLLSFILMSSSEYNRYSHNQL